MQHYSTHRWEAWKTSRLQCSGDSRHEDCCMMRISCESIMHCCQANAMHMACTLLCMSLLYDMSKQQLSCKSHVQHCQPWKRQTTNACNTTYGRAIGAACTCIVFIGVNAEDDVMVTLLPSMWLQTPCCMWHITCTKRMNTTLMWCNMKLTVYACDVFVHMMAQRHTCTDKVKNDVC